MINLNRLFALPAGLSPQLRANFINFYWDIAWWGLYIGATSAFLGIYATRSGATPQEIGLLTALPAMLTLMLALPTGRFLRRVPATRATVLSALSGRVLLLGYVFIPWLVPPGFQVTAILALTVLIAIPNTVIGISFSQFFVEGIPSEWRGMVVGTRFAIMSIISFLTTLVCGQVLERIPFPAGYQVVFFIGFSGAIMTVFQLRQIHPVADPALPPAPPPSAQRRLLPHVDGQGRVYLKVIALMFCFNFTNNMIAPLIPNLLVHTINLSDAMISIGTALSNMLVFLISLQIARLTRRTGNRNATALGAALLAVQSIALALAGSATVYLIAAFIGGLASGVLGTAQYNYQLDFLPQSERPAWLSWNLMLGNAAVLLGALSGPIVAQWFGVPNAILLFGTLRLVVGLAIFKWG